ncbi:serine/arginine-rich splicing factor RSZ21A isoform X2 [Dendrobium catenatum]|uniref:serine/arginine-rich splicing factor RSZ21A isoform X2 n=1 Tax=Dendrobium catenatum TaxID=906689 RepID=UPI0009F31112|nr:serine/arginine-rich splicing factor RSZ21A isoform X2 [Dendrobium catenatum]
MLVGDGGWMCPVVVVVGCRCRRRDGGGWLLVADGCYQGWVEVMGGDEQRRRSIKLACGRNGWHVELSHNSRSGRGSRCSSEDISCSECGQSDHVARDCCLHGSGGLESGRHYRSSSDQYHQSPSYRYRSFSPLRRSPRGIRDTTYRHGYRGQSYTRSPIYHGNNPHDSNGCN